MNNRLSIVGHDPGQKQWHVTRAAVTTFNFFTRIFVAQRSFSKQGCLKKNTEETHTVCIASHYMSVAQPTHPQSSATLQSKLISKVMVESAPKVASPAHLERVGRFSLQLTRTCSCPLNTFNMTRRGQAFKSSIRRSVSFLTLAP